MKKISMAMIGIIISLSFSGCELTESNEDFSKTRSIERPHQGFWYRKICIENVVYLYGKRRLSVYINPKTLKPQNCEERK